MKEHEADYLSLCHELLLKCTPAEQRFIYEWMHKVITAKELAVDKTNET